MKHLDATHPRGEGAGLYPAAQAPGTGWRDRLPHTRASLSLCPAAFLRAHRGQSKGCAAPLTLEDPSGPPWARSYLLQFGPEGGQGWDGVPGSPLATPLTMRQHPFCPPVGATWPHLLLLGAHQLHTSGKGTMHPQARAFPKPHPGVCPPPAPPAGRSNQGGRLDSVLQLWLQWGKGAVTDQRLLQPEPLELERGEKQQLSSAWSFIPQVGSWVSRWQQF